VDFLLSEAGTGWMTLASTVIAALGLVVGTVIAVNTNRLQRRMHEQTLAMKAAESQNENRRRRQEQKAAIQRALDEFREACADWVGSSDRVSADPSPIRRKGQVLLAAAAAAGEDGSGLAARIDLVEGQAYWIGDPDRLRRWLQATTPADAVDDAEWAAGVMNGLLDVVKDSVLRSTAAHDDGALIRDDFWTELAVTAFADEAARSSVSLHPAEKTHLAARVRWLPSGATGEAKERIAALIHFKVLAENALALAMYGTFSDGLQDRSRDTKFITSGRHVLGALCDEVSRSADAAIARIDAVGETAATPAL
jgi:hypothetical protein